MTTTQFAPFDPTRFRIESHRQSTTQGSFSVFFDGKKVATYADDIVMRKADGVVTFEGLPGHRIQAIAKRLWERGDAGMRIAPLWGGKAYVSADCDDVITLTRQDRTTLLCRVECSSYAGRGTQRFWFYDPANPAIDEHLHAAVGSGIGDPRASASPPLPRHLRAVIGNVEWAAATRFAAYLQSVSHLESIERQWMIQTLGAEGPSETMRMACAMQACEVQGLIDFMDARGTAILAKAVTQHDSAESDSPVSDVQLMQATTFMVAESAWTSNLTKWSADANGQVMVPQWMGEFADHPNPDTVKTWVEPYTYRPAIYRERMTASPEEWMVRAAKQACVDRFGRLVRPGVSTATNPAPAPRG